MADFDPMGNSGDTRDSSSIGDFDPMSDPPASTPSAASTRGGGGVSFAPDTKTVERTPAARAGTPIEIVAVTKQRGSERYAADLQWRIAGAQGSYRVVMKENAAGAGAGTSGGMAVGAAVEIKRIEIVRMLCENCGLQFTAQREEAAGTRAAIAEAPGGDRVRVKLQSGEVVAFPVKALEVVPVEAPKWKKARKKEFWQKKNATRY